MASLRLWFRKWVLNEMTPEERAPYVAWVCILFGFLYFVVGLIGMAKGHPKAWVVIVLSVMGVGYGLDRREQQKGGA